MGTKTAMARTVPPWEETIQIDWVIFPSLYGKRAWIYFETSHVFGNKLQNNRIKRAVGDLKNGRRRAQASIILGYHQNLWPGVKRLSRAFKAFKGYRIKYILGKCAHFISSVAVFPWKKGTLGQSISHFDTRKRVLVKMHSGEIQLVFNRRFNWLIISERLCLTEAPIVKCWTKVFLRLRRISSLFILLILWNKQ